jgi:ferredoxin
MPANKGMEKKMTLKRKIIEINEERCTGCGQCVEACAEGAIRLLNGKARLISENYCDGLAACLGECPEGALSIVEREAAAFDPEAVEDRLQKSNTRASKLKTDSPLPCGCPSTGMEIFSSPCEAANKAGYQESADSTLSHWPIQVKLVPASAPFLRKVHLLVASDCTPVAYPDFQKDFLKGRSVLIGCPKFDDTAEYIDKFAEIFRIADIQSVTILIMEVPCCSKMPLIVRQAMEMAGKIIPTEVVVVSSRGRILKRAKQAA